MQELHFCERLLWRSPSQWTYFGFELFYDDARKAHRLLDITLTSRGASAGEPGAALRDGGVIAAGFDADLDELRGIGAHCDAFLLDLEARERSRTGIANLRVQFNKVHGFFIEVTASGLSRVPADYQRRQTMKNALPLHDGEAERRDAAHAARALPRLPLLPLSGRDRGTEGQRYTRSGAGALKHIACCARSPNKATTDRTSEIIVRTVAFGEKPWPPSTTSHPPLLR